MMVEKKKAGRMGEERWKTTKELAYLMHVLSCIVKVQMKNWKAKAEKFLSELPEWIPWRQILHRSVV